MNKFRAYNCRKCTLCGVRKTPNSKIILTGFPLDPDRCRLWVKATGDEDLVHLPIEKLHGIKFLCDSHFGRDCFNKKGNRLLSTAVPTERLLRPPLSDECLKEFPLHIQSFYHKEINKSGTHNIVLHSFPDPEKEAERFYTWVNAARIDISSSDHYFIYKNRRICHDHFAEKYLTWTRRLTHDAIPTLHLPDKPVASSTQRNISSTSSVAAPVKPIVQESTSPRPIDQPTSSTQRHTSLTASVAAPDDVADMTQDLTMYCDDEEPASPPPDVIENIKHPNNTLHEGYHCDVCKSEIRGFRYTCVQCSDLDLCSACENNKAHHHHYVLRVPEPRPYAEVQSVLARIRSHLMHKLDPIKQTEEDNDDAVSIKSEVKSESEDDEDNDETLSQDSSHSTVESITQKQKDHDDEDSAYNIERLDPEDSTEPIDSIDISSDDDTQSNAEDEENTQSMETDSLSSTARQQPTSKHKLLPSTVRKKIIGNLKDFIRTRQTPLSGKRIRVLPVLKKSNVSIPKEIAHKFEFKPQKKVMVLKLPQGAVLNDNLRVVVQRLPLSEETRHNADIDNR